MATALWRDRTEEKRGGVCPALGALPLVRAKAARSVGSQECEAVDAVSPSPGGAGGDHGILPSAACACELSARTNGNERFAERAQHAQCASALDSRPEHIREVTQKQLALAWLLAQGDGVVPIPGTRSPERLAENTGAADAKLTEEDLARIHEALPQRRLRRLLPGGNAAPVVTTVHSADRSASRPVGQFSNSHPGNEL